MVVLISLRAWIWTIPEQSVFRVKNSPSAELNEAQNTLAHFTSWLTCFFYPFCHPHPHPWRNHDSSRWHERVQTLSGNGKILFSFPPIFRGRRKWVFYAAHSYNNTMLKMPREMVVSHTCATGFIQSSDLAMGLRRDHKEDHLCLQKRSLLPENPLWRHHGFNRGLHPCQP